MAERPHDPHADPGYARGNGWDGDFQTYDELDLPTYVGPATFMNLPWMTDPEAIRAAAVDVAIVGAPFDDAVTYRPGARFGPRAIRQASTRRATTRCARRRAVRGPRRRRRRRRQHRPGLDRARPRDDLPQGPRGRGDRRHPDRPRRRPFDHLAVGQRRRAGTPPGSIGIVHFDAHADTANDAWGVSPATARRCGG